MTPNAVVWVTDSQTWRHSSLYLIIDVEQDRSSEAVQLAAELLMPTSHFLACMSECDDDANTLAKWFGVSYHVASRRVAGLYGKKDVWKV